MSSLYAMLRLIIIPFYFGFLFCAYIFYVVMHSRFSICGVLIANPVTRHGASHVLRAADELLSSA